MLAFRIQLMGQLCWVISVLVGWIAASDQVMMMESLSRSDHSRNKNDLTNITWAHAVNSRSKLEEALKGPAAMLEADIVMGTTVIDGVTSKSEEPIMAHPPAKTSDLSFKKFLSTVSEHNKEKPVKKGIKLDFKQIECVEQVLLRLRDKKKYINFEVWLNADVLPGPVNATTTPVDGKEFLSLAKTYIHDSDYVLSLGWTTRFGLDDQKQDSEGHRQKISNGQYTSEQMDAMIKLWDGADLHGTPVTFPVRAAIAAQSVDTLVSFLGRIGSTSSFTLWSPEDDPKDISTINNFIKVVGKDKVYRDLPFSLDSDSDTPRVLPETTPVNPPDVTSRTKNDTDNTHENNEGSSNITNKYLTFLSIITFILGYFL